MLILIVVEIIFMELSIDFYENEIVGIFQGFVHPLKSLEYSINLRMLKVKI